MMLTLTPAELLEYRRNMAGLEPSNLEFTIERTDGIDIDAIIAARLRRWYVDALSTASTVLLPVCDVASASTIAPGPYPGSSTVTLPDGCLRPAGVRLAGWESQATVLPAEALPDILRRQDNPFARATARYPVAVQIQGRSDAILAFPAAASVASITAVKDPGDTLYILDEALLAQLPLDNLLDDL